jgi:hypothetical protein
MQDQLVILRAFPEDEPYGDQTVSLLIDMNIVSSIEEVQYFDDRCRLITYNGDIFVVKHNFNSLVYLRHGHTNTNQN